MTVPDGVSKSRHAYQWIRGRIASGDRGLGPPHRGGALGAGLTDEPDPAVDAAPDLWSLPVPHRP